MSAGKENGLGGLVRRGAPLRTAAADRVYSAKITVRTTDDDSFAFKRAVLDSKGKLEPTLRAMLRLYAEDEAFRNRVNDQRS